MNNDEVLDLLVKLERRMLALADAAQEAREQAQHVLDRLTLLLDDVTALRQALSAEADTINFRPTRAIDVH